MISTAKSAKAAQYVRMSTEHQQYSIDNQRTAIEAYAIARAITIVATYEDNGRSGLTLSGRPSLRRLIADVVAGQDAFDTILVYDVSRWGRFQDADESAHLEFLCRLAGVQVEYCAEPFANDGTPFASICKVVKRALAAEYSRELSAKVYAGKQRLITLGYRQGGSAGYGLRRCLIDPSGNRKGLLACREYKSIATDRVILVPGPPEEVAVVKRIYHDYTKHGMGSSAIASALNGEGVRSESGRPWSEAVVKRVLTSEKYVGDSVWGRASAKLQTRHRPNPPEMWTRVAGAFEGIVSRPLFEKAQRVRAERAHHPTDEQVIARLRRIHAKHGAITTRLIKADGLLGTNAIRKRFGGLISAYGLVGFRPSRNIDFISINGAARRLRDATAQALLEGVYAQGGTIERLRGACRFRINGEIVASVAVAQQRRSQRGNPRWQIKQGGSNDDLTIAVLMDGRQERARAYYFFPRSHLGRGQLLAIRNPVHVDALGAKDLAPVLRVCGRCEPGTLDRPPVLPGLPLDHGTPLFAFDAAPLAKIAPRRFRSLSKKSYTGAFLRASAEMRDAISMADTVHTRLAGMRRAMALLLVDARAVYLLAAHGIGSVPKVVFPDHHEQARGEGFKSALREQAIDLLASDAINKRARALLHKLTTSRRVEAAECIVLVNDLSEYYARSLVAATRSDDLLEAPRKHVYGARQKELQLLITEGEVLYRESKRALSTFGRDAHDLVAIEAFVRRLLATPKVSAWIASNHPQALQDMKSMSRIFRHSSEKHGRKPRATGPLRWDFEFNVLLCVAPGNLRPRSCLLLVDEQPRADK
jgi:DNA invertase Pin-like site-specific DNA recombinase